MGATDESDHTQPRAPRDAGVTELFLVLSQIGLASFGGGLPAWMHRAFVERRGWLDETEFAAALTLARIMPGVNVVNLAVLIGQRVRGFSGATAAVTGLLLGPGLAVIGIALLYQRFAGTAAVGHALEGAAAAAVGLIIGMGFAAGKRIIGMGAASAGGATGRAGAIAIVASMFVLIGVLRYPTVATVLCMTPLSIARAFFAARTGPTEPRDERG